MPVGIDESHWSMLAAGPEWVERPEAHLAFVVHDDAMRSLPRARHARRARRARHALSLAVLVGLVGLAPTAAAASPSGTHVVTFSHGLTVEAPPAGYGVAASAILVSGGHLDLVLETGADGVTRDVTATPGSFSIASAGSSAPLAAVAGGPGACSDDTYHLLPFKWKSTWRWWFKAGSTPSDMTRAKAETALKSAVNSITGERNSCGRSDKVSATASYQGRTTTRPGVTSTGGCSRDGKSVVGFGDLPSGVLGLTCTTYQEIAGTVDTAVESDVLFNKDDFHWTTTLSGCSSRVMLRSVATHEFGHVFGLGHVSESSHGNLTMSTNIGACDDSAFTLGEGDMLGLERRY
jgi:hypothetical protein